MALINDSTREDMREDVNRIYKNGKRLAVTFQNVIDNLRDRKTTIAADGSGAFDASDLTDMDTLINNLLTDAGNIA
jgi:hypothetical protein